MIILENDEEMAYDLKAKYNEFNEKFFDSRLPDIPIRWGILKGAGGIVTYSYIKPAGWTPPSPLRVKMGVADKLEGCKLVPGSLKMVISKLYKRSADAIDKILMHEMIHVLHAVTGKLGESHGPHFHADRRYYSKKSGIDIPLKDKVDGYEQNEIPSKKLGVVLVKIPNNKFAYAIITAKFMSENYGKFASNPDDIEVIMAGYPASMWIIETPEWTAKSMSMAVQRKADRSTKMFMLLDQNLLSNLLANGTRLAGKLPTQSLTEAVGNLHLMFWITRDGRRIEVDASHDYTAAIELGMEPEDDDGNYAASNAAYSSGWIHVNAESNIFGADWTRSKTTPAAILSLHKLVSELPEFDAYFFNSQQILTQKRAMGYLMGLYRTTV